MKTVFFHRVFRVTLLALVVLALGTAGTAWARKEKIERPAWIAQPKSSDLMYVYVVGHAAGKATEEEAREAAFRDALKKLANQVSLPDGTPAPIARIRHAEVLPGCTHVESARSGYEAWVQASWPTAEKKKLQEQADRGDVKSESAPVKTIGPDGGVVEDAGVKITIPRGALSAPTKITITPVANPPPLFDTPLPEELAQVIRVGPAFDLGPSGTHFRAPVTVEMKMPEEWLAFAREQDRRIEVGYFDGAKWQPFENARLTGDGKVSFQTTHFTLALPVAMGGMIIGGVVMVKSGYDLLLHPEKWITAQSQAINDHIKAGKVSLPSKEKVAVGKTISLGLGRSFKPYAYLFIETQFFYGDGETMLTQATASCQEATFFTASTLRAGGDPRFQKFICVQGSVIDPKIDPETGKKTDKRTGHMWIEIEVDGKIWVVDTASVKDLPIMPKDEAYRIYDCRSEFQFTDEKDSRRKYKGLPGPSTTMPDAPNTSPTNVPNASTNAPAGTDKPATEAALKDACQKGYDLGQQVRNGTMSMDDVKRITREEYGSVAPELKASFRKGYADGSAAP